MPRTDDLCDHVTKAVVYDLRSIGQFGLVAAIRCEMHQCPLRGEAVKSLVTKSIFQALCSQGAVRLMIANIRLMGQLKSIRSVVDATQR